MLHIVLALTIALITPSWLPASEEEISFDDLALKPKGLSRGKPATLRERIEYLNSNSFIQEERDWECHSFYEWLCKSIRTQAEPSAQYLRDTSFKMMRTTSYAASSIIQDSTTWQDLAIFGGKIPGDNYVGKALCRAQSDLGKAQFMYLLGANTADHEEISRRQTIIKTLIDKPKLRATFDTLLKNYVPSENLFLSHWRHEQYLKDVTRDYLFTDSLLQHGNSSPTAVMGKYLWNFIGGRLNDAASNVNNLRILILCLLTAMIDTSDPLAQEYAKETGSLHKRNFLFKLGWNSNLKAIKYGITALNAYFIYQQLDRSIDYIVDALLFEEIIHYKLTHVAHMLRILQNSAQLLSQEKELLDLLPELKALLTLFATTHEQNAPLRELLDLLLSNTFAPGSSSTFANRGKVMIGYVALQTLRDELLPALQAFGLLDSYCGIAKLLEEAPDRFCFAQLETADTPHLYLKDFVNPLVPADKVITNSVELGNNAPSRNCIITGPNAGGKSTLIKAIGINVLLAQSLGIASARRCVLTPFNFVATYLNITDDINAGNSLFKAEVLRTQELINAMLSLPAGQHGLLIFDEVFNGTTPVEGSAAAYAVAEFLGKILNSITIVATHFEQLTKLEADVENGYKNYKVTVKINDDGSLTYPFKLESGISDQHIALDMLRNEGYSGAIVTRTANLLGRA